VSIRVENFTPMCVENLPPLRDCVGFEYYRRYV
jgi:hypothetical protein